MSPVFRKYSIERNCIFPFGKRRGKTIGFSCLIEKHTNGISHHLKCCGRFISISLSDILWSRNKHWQTILSTKTPLFIFIVRQNARNTLSCHLLYFFCLTRLGIRFGNSTKWWCKSDVEAFFNKAASAHDETTHIVLYYSLQIAMNFCKSTNSIYNICCSHRQHTHTHTLRLLICAQHN